MGRDSMNNSEQCLIVVLLPSVLLAKSTCVDIESGFRHQGRDYHLRSNSDFNGFYDFLRSHDDEVVGLTMYPSENIYFLSEYLDDKEYAAVRRAKDESPIFDLSFSTAASIVDELKSDDQEFGCNWLLSSDDGVLALTFNANNISGSFLERLEEVEIRA